MGRSDLQGNERSLEAPILGRAVDARRGPVVVFGVRTQAAGFGLVDVEHATEMVGLMARRLEPGPGRRPWQPGTAK